MGSEMERNFGLSDSFDPKHALEEQIYSIY